MFQYGVLICIKCHDFRRSDLQLGLALYLLIPCHLLIAYLIELIAAANARQSRATAKPHHGSTSPTEDRTSNSRSFFPFMGVICFQTPALLPTCSRDSRCPMLGKK
jgi:hypothetical protein